MRNRRGWRGTITQVHQYIKKCEVLSCVHDITYNTIKYTITEGKVSWVYILPTLYNIDAATDSKIYIIYTVYDVMCQDTYM